MRKRIIALFVTLCMVLALFPVSVFAEGNWEIVPAQKQESVSAEVQTMMPVRLEGHVAYEPVYAAKSVDEYTDIEQTVKDVRQQMVNRYRYISFPLRVSKSEVRDETELEALIVAIYALALTHTGVADEGDYLLWSLESVEYSVSGEESDTDYDLTVKLEVEYYTGSSEESYVRSQVQSILSGFGFTEETDDYTKIFSIYTFICDTVAYDYDNLANPNYTTQFTAYSALYNGKAVCQGYALLLYYMLLTAGIDCRIISGYDVETGMPHAWNIVQLDGVWYNVDATWDAGYYDYLHFLKAPASFADHIRDEAYEIPEFHQLYPMAQEDYELTLPVISGGDCGENIQYTIYADGYLEITGSGDLPDWTGSVAPWNTYSSYVRYVYVDEGIRSIGSRSFRQLPYLLVAELAEGVETITREAFYWNERLMGVYIPTTVKTVGEYAFYYCNQLFAVVISDLSAWCGIDFEGYYANPLTNGADLYLNEDVITDLVIPNDVTAIKTYAFTGGNFVSVTFPSGITEVAPYAFDGCKQLKSVYITDLAAWCGIDFSDAEKPWENGNPLALGADLYLNGAKVTKLVIPDGVQRIGNAAFYGSSITAVTIPASVKTIGASAFSECQQLRNVSISDLSAWCGIDFADSTANPLALYGALYLNGTQLTNLVIPEGTTAIKDYAFMNGKFYSVTLPVGLKTIGECAFTNTLIKQIELPAGLESIGAVAFKGCTNLTSVVIPEGITALKNSAFAECHNLVDITLPSSLQTIEMGVFYDYDRPMVNLYLTDLAAWCSVEGYIQHNINLYLNGVRVTDLVIPDGVSVINADSFYGFNIDTLTLPDSVTAIGANAFANTDLTTINWGSGLTEIGESAFSSTKLTEIRIPDSVQILGNYAFGYCEDVTSITFGKGLTVIPQGAFQGCAITELYLPDHIREVGGGAFFGCEALTTVHTGSGITKIELAFSYCNALTDVTFGENLVSLSNPFFGCDRIDSITFTGNAPAFEGYGSDFSGLTATIYYPAGNATWTPDVLQNYGGRITWVASCTGHTFENGVCTACGEKDPDFQPNGIKGDADGSGEVDYLDAMIVLQYHTGIVGDDMLDLTVCDVDGSGEVDYLDAMLLLQYHTGVIPEL